MRTRLIFVRHGESVHTLDAVIGGPQGCRGLTALGHEQARRLADRLAADLVADGPVAVYSSVLRRAVQTAQPIAAALAATPVLDCGLCTWHAPSYADGMPTSRFQAERAIAGGGVFRPFEQDNESWAELVVRASRAIMDVAHRHRGRTMVLVGHSETVDSAFHAPAAQPLSGVRPARGSGLGNRVDHRRRSHRLAAASLDPVPLQRCPLTSNSRPSQRPTDAHQPTSASAAMSS